ncbi:MAG: hypothetical protein FJ304_26780, partial [Planctomycetes bacterium]|nr:hypothetical protein [Planctomycetota bacterium]
MLEDRLVPTALYPALHDRIGGDLSFLSADFQSFIRSPITSAVGPAAPAAYSPAPTQPNIDLLRIDNGRVLVDGIAEGDAGVLASEVVAIGGRITAVYGRVVSASLPIQTLPAFAALPELRFGRPAYAPIRSAGEVDDQAVPGLAAGVGAVRFGVDGSGVTVGILSDSFNALGGADADVDSGDLPQGVNVVQDYSGDPSDVGDEGRAMAQLVHGIAPGAAIAFYSGAESEAGLAQGIATLAKPVGQGGAGAHVIVDDLSFPTEPIFQDGIVAQAVDDAVVTQGVSYFSSAGNFGRAAYQNPYSSTTMGALPSWAPASATLDFHDFDTGGGTDIYQPLTVPFGQDGNSVSLTFQWASPYASAGGAGATCDLDIYLLDSTKTTVLASQTTSNLGGDPTEVLSYSDFSSGLAETYYIAINLKAGTAPPLMKYILLGNQFDPSLSVTIAAYATNTGASFGHNQAQSAAGVGAAYYAQTTPYGSNPAVQETYSSAGGTPFLFDAAGNPLAVPEFRDQPRFTAVDGTDTTFFQTDLDGNQLLNFSGTSAAAPHAAAVAALMRQLNPALNPDEVYGILADTAADMGAAGFDFDTGAGLIRADRALATVSNLSITGTVFNDANGDGTRDGGEAGVANATVYLDSNNNGVPDAGVSGRFESTDVPKAVPDAAPDAVRNALSVQSQVTGDLFIPSRVASQLNVSGLPGRVTSVTVTLSLLATTNSDLGVTLVSPSGIRIPLFSQVGGNGNNFTDLTLDDSAATPIQSVVGDADDITGSFRPQVSLGGLVGESPNGVWRLEARDFFTGETGAITDWSLVLSYAEERATTDSLGQYAFAGLAPSSYYGTYNVRPLLAGGARLTAPANPLNLALANLTPLTGLDFGVSTADADGPGVTIRPPSVFVAVGTGAGVASQVMVLNVTTGATVRTISPFVGFQGGVQTALGDVNGDFIDDIIVGAGVNGHVKVFDGATGSEIRSFFAFDGYSGAVTVAGGDVNGDGQDDIIVGAGVNGHVKVFDGVTGSEIRSFFAFDGYSGAVTVAGGDVNDDGFADIIVGAGINGHVKVFDGTSLAAVRSFFAFDGYTGGV